MPAAARAPGPAATVLTARAIRPDYRSAESFRHIVLAGGTVRALAHSVADAARAAGPSPRWIDLGPACVGPGFIDTHIHALQAAADLRLVGLREAGSLDELLTAVRERGLRRTAGEWTVTGRNWHESQLREGRLPTGAELDALGIASPVLLRRGSHLAVLNSRAAALLGGPGLAAGPVEQDALIARALDLAGQPGPTERAEDLAAVLARFGARGITSIREAGVDAAGLGLFRALRSAARLPLRCDLLWRIREGSDPDSAREQIAGMPDGATDSRGPHPAGAAGPSAWPAGAGGPSPRPAGAGDPYLRLTGVKVFVDGRIADAASLRVTPADLWVILEAALRRSGGAGCHAVTDGAVRMVLGAYERAMSAGLAGPGRLVVEHALRCGPETIRRLAASGVGVSAHPGIVYEFAGDIRRHWGEENAARAAPVRDMVRAGVRVAAGSDGDVPPFDPLRVIWFMVTRQSRSGGPIGAGQAVPRDVALALYTRHGAELLGVAARRGALRPGMDADLAAFSADPLTCPVDELPETEVLLTLVAGRPVHDPSRLMEERYPDG